MKSKIFLCVAMVGIAITTTAAKPKKPAKNVNSRAAYVIEAFVDASMHNDAALFSKILNSSAVLKVNKQDKVIQHTKSDLVGFYRRSGAIVLNCGFKYEILSSSDCVVIARVDFEFPEFVQQNYITLEKDNNGQWKVMQINRFNT